MSSKCGINLASRELDLLGITNENNVDLASYTSFRIGGPCDLLVQPKNSLELQQVLKVANKNSILTFVLGKGTNVVVSDRGIRGMVIRLSGEFCDITIDQKSNEINVGAAASFPALTKKALALGYECALGWLGTPGSAGGALIMNAGTNLGCIGCAVKEIRAVDENGPLLFERKDLIFRYRETMLPKKAILTGATLFESNPACSKKLQKLAMGLAQKRRLTQPKQPSAGSIFKNPTGDFAGRLIEGALLKGHTIGQAKISENHANFIVNLGGATAADVYQLANLAKKTIYEKFRIVLEFEVKFIGEVR